MKKYFCIDVGGTFVKYAVADMEGNILWEDKIPSPHTDQSGFTEKLATLVPSDVSGIAICFPGFVDGKNGVCINCGTLDWLGTDYRLADELSKASGLPVTVENDAHCACFAELWKGSLKGITDGAVMVIGTAVGMGLVLNGKLYTGSVGKAGEPGYNLSDRNDMWGFACSIPLLCKEAAATLGREEMSGAELMEMYRSEDEIVVPIVKNYYKYLTEGMFTIQNLFDFEKIAIGGGISNSDIFIESLKNEFHSIYAKLPYPLHEPEIERCSMKSSANLVGALYYHLNKNI